MNFGTHGALADEHWDADFNAHGVSGAPFAESQQSKLAKDADDVPVRRNFKEEWCEMGKIKRDNT